MMIWRVSGQIEILGAAGSAGFGPPGPFCGNFAPGLAGATGRPCVPDRETANISAASAKSVRALARRAAGEAGV